MDVDQPVAGDEPRAFRCVQCSAYQRRPTPLARAAQRISALRIREREAAELRGLLGVRAMRFGFRWLQDEVLRSFDLTEEELRVGHRLLFGLTYAEIARREHRSQSNVKGIARRIFRKMDVRNRAMFVRVVNELIERL